MHGRGVDGFAGVPMALRLESINAECARLADAEGMRWRLLLLEDVILARRIKKFKAEQEQKTA